MNIPYLARKPRYQKEVVALDWLGGRSGRTFTTLALRALVCWRRKLFCTYEGAMAMMGSEGSWREI